MLTHLAFAGLPGGYEILIIGFVALLIFGNRLPTLMRSLGKSVTEFKKGVAGIEDDLDMVVTADKKPAATTTTTTANVNAERAAASEPIPHRD